MDPPCRPAGRWPDDGDGTTGRARSGRVVDVTRPSSPATSSPTKLQQELTGGAPTILLTIPLQPMGVVLGAILVAGILPKFDKEFAEGFSDSVAEKVEAIARDVDDIQGEQEGLDHRRVVARGPHGAMARLELGVRGGG